MADLHLGHFTFFPANLLAALKECRQDEQVAVIGIAKLDRTENTDEWAAAAKRLFCTLLAILATCNLRNLCDVL